MSHKVAIIIRGPSGSGKSTLTKALTAHHGEENVTVVSADEFFMEDGMVPDTSLVVPDGGSPIMIPGRVYKFNPTKLGEAHAESLGNFIGALADKRPVVIVDNTNIHNWEWRNYAMIAKAHGYEIQIQEFRVETVEQISECQRRNVHRVPADIVAKMCIEFEPCANAVVHQVFPIEEKKKK